MIAPSRTAVPTEGSVRSFHSFFPGATMAQFDYDRYSETECAAKFRRLFPHGFSGPDVFAELAPVCSNAHGVRASSGQSARTRFASDSRIRRISCDNEAKCWRKAEFARMLIYTSACVRRLCESTSGSG